MKVAAIVLAAGKSSRFEGGNKLLANFGGKPMLAHVLNVARGVGEVVVITGNHAEEVGAIAAAQGAQIIHNPHYAEGISGSIRAGIMALSDDVDAAFIMLGDMPLVKAETLAMLKVKAEISLQKLAFVPIFGEEWGNPVLVRRALFGKLMTLSSDQGARKLLLSMPEHVAEVPVEDAGVLADFDTREAMPKL